MIIIVDGIDRVGKTTLCNLLSESLDYPISKDDVRYALTYDDMLIGTEKNNTFVNLIEQGCLKNIIFDRFHFTEFTYGVIERGYINTFMIDIDKRLSNLNVLLILVKPTDVNFSSNEHGKSLNKHNAVFNALFECSQIKNKIVTDYTKFDETVKYVRGIVFLES